MLNSFGIQGYLGTNSSRFFSSNFGSPFLRAARTTLSLKPEQISKRNLVELLDSGWFKKSLESGEFKCVDLVHVVNINRYGYSF